MAEILAINPTTYETTLLGGDKVEIGNNKEALDFKPHIKLNRWDGECFIKVGLPTTEKPAPVIEGDKVKWVEQDREVDFYPLEPRIEIAKDKDGKDVEFKQCELGGFEFEVILKKKPTTNKIVLDIETQGLKFYPQSHEIPEDSIAPENVKGSIAVYHATCGNMHKGKATAEKYKTGKAFHIYRPKITDAEGKWVWGELSLDEQAGTLTTTIPQEFLDSAVYPVSIDPNFGNESTGGLLASWPADWIYGLRATGGDNRALSISVWSHLATQINCKCALYLDSDNGLVGETEAKSSTAATTWETFAFVSPPSISAVDYYISFWGDQTLWTRYDSSTDCAGYKGKAYGSWDNPITWDVEDYDNAHAIYCTYEEAAVVDPPTVTTQAADLIEATTARGNGTITATGGENPTRYIDWGTSTGNYPNAVSAGVGGAGAYTAALTGLPTGTTIYCRARAVNSAGTGTGSEVTFLTKPAAPTSVQATDGVHTDKVVVTWAKSTGATGYQVYRNGTPLGWLGDVATFDDTGAGAPTVTPGTASASDGTQTAHIVLSLAGESANNGATYTYKVRAKNATGESVDSGTNTGYRGVGSLTRQWYRSAADSDATYSSISGATSDPYNDTAAPTPTITPGAAAASDGLYVTHVALSLSGDSANVGAGRYYKCLVSATGATPQYSTANRGYRGVGTLTYQWQRSAADSDATYSNIGGATTASYDDTGAPADGSGRYYRCVENATGAAQQISSVDRGYRYTWRGKISGVTNPAKIAGVAVANIAKVKGVA